MTLHNNKKGPVVSVRNITAPTKKLGRGPVFPAKMNGIIWTANISCDWWELPKETIVPVTFNIDYLNDHINRSATSCYPGFFKVSGIANFKKLIGLDHNAYDPTLV